MKLYLIFFFLFLSNLNAREAGQTEITTEEGIEVYQKEKYYLLKKNVLIESDNFTLRAQKVKAHFDKDLEDITNILSIGDVSFESNTGLFFSGNESNHDVKNEKIIIKGEKSLLKNKDITMLSDGSIELNNISGDFKLYGPNSKIIAETIKIVGEDIKGKYVNVDGSNVIDKLDVKDKTQVNIITQNSNMFAKSAKYNKQENIIELFEDVIVIRNNESIVGDYAKMNTLDESYFVKTNYKSKKVKAILEKTDE